MKLYFKLFIFFVLFNFNLAHANIAEQTQALIKQYESTKSSMAKHPTLNFDQELRFLGRDALLLESYRQLYKNDTPTDASLKRRAEILIDSYNDECQRNKSSTFCKSLADDKAAYKTKYGTEYTPQAIKYPKADLNNYTYTFADGKIFDLKQNAFKQSSASGTTTVSTASTSATVGTSASVSTSATAAAAQDPSGVSCEWMPGTKRRLLNGEGCESSICSAMVICTKNGKKIKRLATCSSDLCADGKATACHQQLGFGSKKVVFGNDKASSSQPDSPQRKSNKESSTR